MVVAGVGVVLVITIVAILCARRHRRQNRMGEGPPGTTVSNATFQGVPQGVYKLQQPTTPYDEVDVDTLSHQYLDVGPEPTDPVFAQMQHATDNRTYDLIGQTAHAPLPQYATVDHPDGETDMPSSHEYADLKRSAPAQYSTAHQQYGFSAPDKTDDECKYSQRVRSE
jgi:hypothetical protein